MFPIKFALVSKISNDIALVLGDLDNRKPSGILRSNENPGNIKNNVTWAKVAR